MTSFRLSYAGCVRSLVIAASIVLGGLLSACGRVAALDASESPAPPSRPAVKSNVSLEGPFTHANLTIYVVRGSTNDARDYITLDEGLAARAVVVREQGARAGQDQAQVNTLEIDNQSDKWLFLQAGDIVKGGKQDRTIMTDLTLAPRSGPRPIEAFCVEHGRWTPGSDGPEFRDNPGIVAGSPLKIAIQGEKSQPRVWQEVARAETMALSAAGAAGFVAAPPAAAPTAPVRLSSTGTYNAIAENKTLSSRRDAYVNALLPQINKQRDAIGLAVAINGTVTAADLYASSALFQRVSGKLLKSYALESVLSRNEASGSEAPTKEQVRAFLAKPAAARPTTETVGGSMQRSTREADDVVMYEYGQSTRPIVHRNYLKK